MGGSGTKASPSEESQRGLRACPHTLPSVSHQDIPRQDGARSWARQLSSAEEVPEGADSGRLAEDSTPSSGDTNPFFLKGDWSSKHRDTQAMGGDKALSQAPRIE